MNNATLKKLVDLYDAKCVEYEKLPMNTDADRIKADVFYRDHVVRLSKEIARLRAELEQQQQPTLDTQRKEAETRRKEFDAETRRLEKQRNEIDNSTDDDWQTLDRQIFLRYKY